MDSCTGKTGSHIEVAENCGAPQELRAIFGISLAAFVPSLFASRRGAAGNRSIAASAGQAENRRSAPIGIEEISRRVALAQKASIR